jgi:hypothetical protein
MPELAALGPAYYEKDPSDSAMGCEFGDCLFAITRAGFPTAVAPSGTSHSTTLIAPILA